MSGVIIDARRLDAPRFLRLPVTGARWCVLPSAVGFVDPLLSSGIPLEGGLRNLSKSMKAGALREELEALAGQPEGRDVLGLRELRIWIDAKIERRPMAWISSATVAIRSFASGLKQSFFSVSRRFLRTHDERS